MSKKKALLLIDIQNDFVPGGRLAVGKGDEVISVANKLLEAKVFDLVVATQDWHPADHKSFASNNPGKKPGEMSELAGLPQVMWPDHCVQGSPGAEFVAALKIGAIEKTFRKGADREIDSYSGFFDNGRRKATGLGAFLKERGIAEVFVMGLATDFCVRFSALDAASLGFATCLIEDGCRGVNLKPGDSEEAVRQMKAAGVVALKSGRL